MINFICVWFQPNLQPKCCLHWSRTILQLVTSAVKRESLVPNIYYHERNVMHAYISNEEIHWFEIHFTKGGFYGYQ